MIFDFFPYIPSSEDFQDRFKNYFYFLNDRSNVFFTFIILFIR